MTHKFSHYIIMDDPLGIISIKDTQSPKIGLSNTKYNLVAKKFLANHQAGEECPAPITCTFQPIANDDTHCPIIIDGDIVLDSEDAIHLASYTQEDLELDTK